MSVQWGRWNHMCECVCERVNIVGIWKLYVCAYILSHWNKCEISNKCFETHEYLYIDWRDNCICFRTQWISVAQQWCPVVVKYAHFKTTFTALFSLSLRCTSGANNYDNNNINKLREENRWEKWKFAHFSLLERKTITFFSSLDCHFKNEMAHTTNNKHHLVCDAHLFANSLLFEDLRARTSARTHTKRGTKLGKLSCDNVPLNASI